MFVYSTTDGESFLGGFVNGFVILFAGALICAFCSCCTRLLRKGTDEVCEVVRNCPSRIQGLLSGFSRPSDPPVEVSGQVGRARSCSVILSLELATEREEGQQDAVSLQSLPVDLTSGDESGVAADQHAPPPDYSTVIASSASSSSDEVTPSAPPMPSAPSMGDQSPRIGMPPPSYESLFKGESTAWRSCVCEFRLVFLSYCSDIKIFFFCWEGGGEGGGGGGSGEEGGKWTETERERESWVLERAGCCSVL